MSTIGKPAVQTVRYTNAQYARLGDAAKYRAKSLQDFASDAIMGEIVKVETEMRADEEYQKRKRKRKEATAVPPGLGIRDKLLAQNEERTARRAPTDDNADTAPSPTAAPAAAPAPRAAEASQRDADSLKHLAVYVVKGPQWNREDRLREAVKILGSAANGSEERMHLAKALDDQIAILDGKPSGEPFDLFERIKAGLPGILG